MDFLISVWNRFFLLNDKNPTDLHTLLRLEVQRSTPVASLRSNGYSFTPIPHLVPPITTCIHLGVILTVRIAFTEIAVVSAIFLTKLIAPTAAGSGNIA